MPELPEVEVVRRGLQSRLPGRPVTGVDVRAPRLRWPLPEGLDACLTGRAPDRIDRRGKYLLMRFEPHGCLIIHLGMSGTLRLLEEPPAPGRHDHVDLRFGPAVLRYHDPRRFGAMLWHPARDGDVHDHPLLSRLGVEPFSEAFDGALLHRATRGRRVAIKQLLLAGQVVVGVGNIYASECLFRAGIRPSTPAFRLTRPRCDLLAGAIRSTLADAIARGGSTLRDFVSSEGSSGYFQLDCDVYGRKGQACRRCGSTIRARADQQRATYWCPGCQR
ncbi:MAG: hypothetical protein RIS35_1653 [Pseudomonadota bacterium]|jgi:formamidopyrimidine-DNA glycosylase